MKQTTNKGSIVMEILLGLTIVSGIVAIIVGGIVQNSCDELWREQLVKGGYAEYFLDANNQRQWHMKKINLSNE